MNGVVSRPRNGLSLCAGAGGLDMGLMLAEPDFHTRCFVEFDEYPRRAIIAAQRAGYFAPAPIWDDIKTFDGSRYCGIIDTVLAGYPCQPFSAAGQRKGADDPRHLWPHVGRITREVDPVWVFLENVSGHISLGLEAVLRELWDMGWTPASGLFAAGETGAPHERQRIFIVAYSERAAWRREHQAQRARCGRARPAGGCKELAHTNGRHTSAEREQPSGEQRLFADRRGDGAGPMEDAARRGVADASIAGPQGRRADDDPQGRQKPDGSTGLQRGTGLFPPRPSDTDAWGYVIATDPSRAPAFSRSDTARAARGVAALFDPDTAEALEREAGGMALDAILSALDREAEQVVDGAQTVAGLRQLAYGLADRTRALRLLGNGVFPLAAGHAWRTLAASHGLRPLDMEATGATQGTATNEYVR